MVFSNNNQKCRKDLTDKDENFIHMLIWQTKSCKIKIWVFMKFWKSGHLKLIILILDIFNNYNTCTYFAI